jgi:hypothetical protein
MEPPISQNYRSLSPMIMNARAILELISKQDVLVAPECRIENWESKLLLRR